MESPSLAALPVLPCAIMTENSVMSAGNVIYGLRQGYGGIILVKHETSSSLRAVRKVFWVRRGWQNEAPYALAAQHYRTGQEAPQFLKRLNVAYVMYILLCSIAFLYEPDYLKP
jgi:hypothetical protein